MKRFSPIISGEEYRRVERLVKAGVAKRLAQLVREAVAEYVERLNAGKPLNLQDVPLEEALCIRG